MLINHGFQENIVKFPLDELLVNYLRVRALLCSAKRHYQVFSGGFLQRVSKIDFFIRRKAFRLQN